MDCFTWFDGELKRTEFQGPAVRAHRFSRPQVVECSVYATVENVRLELVEISVGSDSGEAGYFPVRRRPNFRVYKEASDRSTPRRLIDEVEALEHRELMARLEREEYFAKLCSPVHLIAARQGPPTRWRDRYFGEKRRIPGRRILKPLKKGLAR